MQLKSSVLVIAILTFVSGVIFFKRSWLERCRQFLLFNHWAPVIFFGSGCAWFLWEVSRLSIADFGAYRKLLFIGFGSVFVLAFFKMRDLLAVRGCGVLGLMMAHWTLESIRGEIWSWRIPYAIGIYAIILYSMWIGAVPYVFREHIDALIKHPCCRRAVASLLVGIGVITAYFSGAN